VLAFGSIVLTCFPFTDLSGAKRRPALVVSRDNERAQVWPAANTAHPVGVRSVMKGPAQDPGVDAQRLLLPGSGGHPDRPAEADLHRRRARSTTAFDISFVDPGLGVYILADRTNKAVNVIDTTDNSVTVQLTSNKCPTIATPCPFAGATGNNDTSGPDGVLIIGKEVWAGDGNSTIKVINLISGVTTDVINTGGKKRADELCFDPDDQLVMMANDAETPFPFVTLISTVSHAVLKTIVMDGTGGTPAATNGIEQCQWSPRTGKFYLNIPEVNGPGNDTKPGAVLQISPQGVIEKTFSIPLDKCAGPQGMALGPENQILLGCNNPNHTVPSTVIINARSGTVIHVLPNEDGGDEVWFNEGDGHYFLAESAALPSQRLGVVDAQTGKVDPSATTGAGGAGGNHSVAADPVKNQVYVPIGSTSGSTICGSLGGSNSQGCIAVFTTTGSDLPGHQP
jgi:hypothetical protein